MVLISEGISRVRAFELPCGIWADGASVAVPRVALVRWYSTWSDKLYQIYINGRYAGTTVDRDQRQEIIHLPSSPHSAVKVKVFAVEDSEADVDFSSELSTSGDSGRVKITFLREQDLPIGGTAEIYFDNGAGEVDYEKRLNDFVIRLWPSRQDKAGFGMSRFGFSDFGYDWAAGMGFGLGIFGRSRFGVDADVIEWVSKPLAGGVYKFAVKIFDSTGNQSSITETGPLTVIPAAKPAEQLGIISFDKQSNQLVLSVS